MRIAFFVVAALSCVEIGCGGVTDVDDLFTPTATTGTTGKGGTGGQTGGSGGISTGGTGGIGGSGGSTGGVGGTGGAGVGGTGGVGGSSGTSGTGGTTIDSGADVRRDAAADARDAGKGSIRCGTTTCDPAVSFCCLTSSNIRCLTLSAATCSASSDRLHCDDSADCPTGQICCATEGASGNGADAVCILTSAGCGAPKQMLCDPATTSPCLNLAGLVCSANSSGIITDYSYCHAP